MWVCEFIIKKKSYRLDQTVGLERSLTLSKNAPKRIKIKLLYRSEGERQNNMPHAASVVSGLDIKNRPTYYFSVAHLHFNQIQYGIE